MASVTRRGFTGFGAGLMGLAAAACGGATQTGAGAGGDATKSRQPLTLRVNHRTEKYIPEVGKQFTQKYPHITVGIRSRGSARVV